MAFFFFFERLQSEITYRLVYFKKSGMYKQALRRFLVTPIIGGFFDARNQKCKIRYGILL